MFLTVFTRAPPATFPRAEAKIKTINLPENVYVKKFYKIYPDSKYHDAIKYCRFFFVSQGGFFFSSICNVHASSAYFNIVAA